MAQQPIINQKQLGYYTDYNISIPDLCSELSYFVIFDCPNFHQNTEMGMKKPIVVTFRHQDITFKDILQRFNGLNTNMKKRKHLRFALSKGYRIPMKSTVLDLKKNLRKSTLDGVVLFTVETNPQLESDSDEQMDFDNECGLMQFIGIQQQFDKQKKFTFHFILPKCKYVISISINPNCKVDQLIQLFYKEVVKQFKIYLQQQDIQQFLIKGTKNTLKSKDTIANVKYLYDDSQIEVIMMNLSIKFIKNIEQYNKITLIKEFISPITLKKQTKKIIVNYEEIKNMQISIINSTYFLEKGQKENKNNPICLKVMQMIIKGWQKLSKLDFAIKKLKELGEVILVGYFINEKMVFYKQIPQILKAKDAKQFTLQQLQIPIESKKERTKCDQLINQRLSTMQAYFQDKSHIEPILVYTSNLKYKDRKTGKINKIYDTLNSFLRNQSVLVKSALQICQEWVYRYTSTLLLHLQNIGGETCKVYRGVNYDPQGKVGDLITFKPFTSTSKVMQVAIQFAMQRYTQDKTLPLTIFQMQILSGKPIDKLSYYKTQQQLLLQPFTQFVITSIRQNVSLRFPNIQGADYYNFQVYALRELESNKQMPKTTNNYILWIDDKPSQGKEIFNKLIEEFRYPTVLFQIQTTNKLKEWLEERQNIINDASSKIIMITNMVRTEEKGRNFYAGAESINLVREYLPNIPIAVYVRDTKASENNLNQKNVSRHHLEVISQFDDLSKFVQKNIQVTFRSIFPKQQQFIEKKPIKNLSSTQYKNFQPQISMPKKSKSQFSKQQKGKCQIM